MPRFDNKLDAMMYARDLLARSGMPDDAISTVIQRFRWEKLEQMNIILADPERRAVLRLKLCFPEFCHDRQVSKEKRD